MQQSSVELDKNIASLEETSSKSTKESNVYHLPNRHIKHIANDIQSDDLIKMQNGKTFDDLINELDRLKVLVHKFENLAASF